VHAKLTELVPRPHQGRVFEQVFRPGFADCAPSGRTRLDALARWLQDVAYADVVEAGMADTAVWVVRRTRIRVDRFPRFGETYALATFCSGMGRMWAERRTSIVRVGDSGSTSIARTGDSGPGVEAVSLWVHLDPEHWRPSALSEEEIALYGASAGGRRVTARLRHPLPGSITDRSPWTFRATELDIAGHINNAAYWQPLEEELLGGAEPERIDIELEFRTPCQPGEKLLLRDGARRWIVSADGETHASVLLVDGVNGASGPR
jgi:acyl-ACP thioesterase